MAAVVALMVSGLLMIAFMGANCMLFAAFLTAVLVFGEHLARGDFAEAGWERLLATAVGAVIAAAAVPIGAALAGMVRSRYAFAGDRPASR